MKFVSGSALEGLRLLVVDAHADSCQLITLLFELCGMQVTAAASVSEALKVFVKSQPDVVISGLMMPQEDGYSLIRKIRAFGVSQGGQVPALALTAVAGEENRQRVLASGFHAYLAKPVELDKLVAVVTDLVAAVDNRFGSKLQLCSSTQSN